MQVEEITARIGHVRFPAYCNVREVRRLLKMHLLLGEAASSMRLLAAVWIASGLVLIKLVSSTPSEGRAWPSMPLP